MADNNDLGIDVLLDLVLDVDEQGMVVVIKNGPEGGACASWAARGINHRHVKAALVLEDIARQFRADAEKEPTTE